MADVRGLQLLHELNLRGTLAAAADALYLSHSAASHRLAVLEREVGVPVTERIGRRLRLTETGVALAACAQRLQQEIETTDAVIEQARTTVAGRVRVGLFQTADVVQREPPGVTPANDAPCLAQLRHMIGGAAKDASRGVGHVAWLALDCCCHCPDRSFGVPFGRSTSRQTATQT